MFADRKIDAALILAAFPLTLAKTGRADEPPLGGPRGHITFSVNDTGTGMTPEVKSKVFEAFFTTKRAGKGTGFGLSMVHSFASQSGGIVTVDSAPGQGSTVTILLPMLEMEHLDEPMDEVAV